MQHFTHFDERGQARMVDVGEKAVTTREAIAKGRITMQPATFAMIQQKEMSKGDVLEVARLAGIMAAKRTSDLIPLCHPLALTGIALDFSLQEDASTIEIEATVKITAKTGVEMEALTGVNVAVGLGSLIIMVGVA